MRFLLVLMSRLLFLLAAIWLIRELMRRLTRSSSSTRPVATQLKQDPVCGTYVAENIALKIGAGQDAVHFCSRRCQQEYLREHPEKAI